MLEIRDDEVNRVIQKKKKKQVERQRCGDGIE